MAAQQIVYWSAVPLKDKPYNVANWVSGTEHAYGFPTDRDARAVKGEYKDASGVEEKPVKSRYRTSGRKTRR